MNLLALLVVSVLAPAYGYHILCIHSIHSRSHYNLIYGIVKPLLKAGHEVTFITSFPDLTPTKNLNVIDVSSTQKYMEELHNNSHILTLDAIKYFTRDVFKDVINKPEVRKTLLSTKIDLVITEWFFSDLDAGFAAIHQAPWIVLSGMVMHTRLEHLMDVVRSIPTTPGFNDYPMPLDFQHRISNTFIYLMDVYFWTKHYSQDKSIYEEYFTPLAEKKGIKLPPYSEAIHNISVLFVNSHTTHAPAMSLPPSVVDIGGYYIDEEVPPLPKDLQSILDSSPQGVIYFSMGSVVKSSGISNETRKDLLKLFSELPYTVLWKFDQELEGLPKNVHIRKWMPQSSVLAHPSVKLFITHCGLLSTLEAIKFGVPILAIPVFGDQPSNAKRVVQAGHGLQIRNSPNMGKDLVAPLKEMLSNDSYSHRAKYLSKIFNNRPVSPTRLIQYYVQLVIESQGAPHLRSKTHLYKWYQLWMLDQAAFFLSIVYILYRILKKIACIIVKIFDKKVKKQ